MKTFVGIILLVGGVFLGLPIAIALLIEGRIWALFITALIIFIGVHLINQDETL